MFIVICKINNKKWKGIIKNIWDSFKEKSLWIDFPQMILKYFFTLLFKKSTLFKAQLHLSQKEQNLKERKNSYWIHRLNS